MYRIAFDVTLRRPGCVLLQAAHGCTVPTWLFYELFPAETWLDSGAGVRVYEATRAQLSRLSEMAAAACG